jgi:hypothetical protein
MVLSYPSTALGLNSVCPCYLAHVLAWSMCHVLGLPTRHHWTSDAACPSLEISFGASYGWLALLCVLMRTGRYW